MWSNGQGGINIQYGNVRNTQVYNNTIYNSGPYGLYIGSSSSNATVRNNIVYQSGGIQNYGVGTVLSNNLTTDPKFVNPAGADLRLQAGSPAINAGTMIAIVTTDFDGALEASRHDIRHRSIRVRFYGYLGSSDQFGCATTP